MSSNARAPADTAYPSRGRGRIGIVVPVSNTNLEPDMGLLRPHGVSIHAARAGGYDVDAIPDAEQMRRFALASLDSVIADLRSARPDIILYGCTSATLALGPDFDRTFCKQIAEAGGAPAVTAAGAVVEALAALGVTRIGFCSPYVEALNADAVAFLRASGVNTVSSAYVGRDLGNYGQGALTPDEVFDLGVRADHVDAQAVVLSCTDMRAVETIPALEIRLGKPVVTSNQAMMYAALKTMRWPPADPALGGWLFTV